MDKLRFGPAGIPHSTPKSGIINAVGQVKKLGLECMELEFVRQVYLNRKSAEELAKEGKKQGIVFTAHAPYYVNLNSAEKEKIEASKKRILKSAEMAWIAGGYSVTFHAAYYMKEDALKVYEQVKAQMKEMVRVLQDEGNKIWLRPETTGKQSQFGDVDEILKLSQEIEQVMPCIDFSHLHARTNGGMNSKQDFCRVLEKVEKALGKEGLNNMHIHVSGINYGEKGEKNHMNLEDSDMKYKAMIECFKEFKIKGCVISESPNLEDDALLMQREFR